NISIGDPRDHRRHYYQFSGSNRTVRRPRADSIAGPIQRGFHAALAIFRISGPRRGGGGLRDAASRHYGAHVLATTLLAGPERLHVGYRQGWRKTDDRSGALALGHARLCAFRLCAFGFSSHGGAASGRLSQRLGPR